MFHAWRYGQLWEYMGGIRAWRWSLNPRMEIDTLGASSHFRTEERFWRRGRASSRTLIKFSCPRRSFIVNHDLDEGVLTQTSHKHDNLKPWGTSLQLKGVVSMWQPGISLLMNCGMNPVNLDLNWGGTSFQGWSVYCLRHFYLSFSGNGLWLQGKETRFDRDTLLVAMMYCHIWWSFILPILFFVCYTLLWHVTLIFCDPATPIRCSIFLGNYLCHHSTGLCACKMTTWIPTNNGVGTAKHQNATHTALDCEGNGYLLPI